MYTNYILLFAVSVLCGIVLEPVLSLWLIGLLPLMATFGFVVDQAERTYNTPVVEQASQSR